MDIFKQYITLFLIITIILSTPLSTISASSQNSSILTVSAKAACLVDSDSGKLIYGKNEGLRMPMASTTKIMTAIIAIESGVPLDTVITVPRESVGIEGSSIYLSEGEHISLRALIYGLLLCSANDAAVAIAIYLYGSEEAFVSEMNKKAKELSLTNTHFTNPHGLDNDEHYTTAYELAKIMAYCVKNDTFLVISGTQRKVFPRDDGTTRVMINHNRLLREDCGVISGKTGFTKRSGRCLVTFSKSSGLSLICVTLSAPNDWNDHKALYNMASSYYRRIDIPSLSLEIPVISGTKSTVSVTSEPISVTVNNSNSSLIKKIYAPRLIYASVKKGEYIGKVDYIYNGKTVASVPLRADESIDTIKYRFNIFSYIKELILNIKDILWKK